MRQFIPTAATRRAFTLVELLVSTALIALISVLLVSTTNSTAATWRYTTSRIEQFRGADAAFEAVTRRLSQATLNTYWDYFDAAGKARTAATTNFVPHHYGRQSDLRFVTGATETLVGTKTIRRPTKGVFFQAPLGFVDNAPNQIDARDNFSGLTNLLNTWGYYVEFNRDVRPKFIDDLGTSGPPPRYRYRLMELMQPSNMLTIYGTDTATKAPYNGTNKWFSDSLVPSGSAILSPSAHVLAENVIAMVLLPKLSKKEDATGAQLSKNFEYKSASTTPSAVQPITENQLPPIVQVTMVAIDEASASRIANNALRPALDAGLDTLFLDSSETKFAEDLLTLQNVLSSSTPPISFRIFTTNVSIRGAKWSRSK